MGWASNLNTPTATFTSSGSTTSTFVYIDVTNTVSNAEVQKEEWAPPRFKPDRHWFKSPTMPRQLRSRHGFQQMSRVPCYRGVRTR